MFRSLIFVPSNSEKYINKAKTLNADIVCFDLEDSVPNNQKDLARQTYQIGTYREDYISGEKCIRKNKLLRLRNDIR